MRPRGPHPQAGGEIGGALEGRESQDGAWGQVPRGGRFHRLRGEGAPSGQHRPRGTWFPL